MRNYQVVWTFQFPSWFHITYLIDWFLSITLFLILMIYCHFFDPFDRYLPQNDPSLSYPNKDSIVSDAVLMIITVVFPIICFLIVQIRWRSSHDFHHSVLGLMVSIFLTNFVSYALKTSTGRYRPNWYSTYSTQLGNEGHYSFPSGHSSNSFAGMVFLTLYFMGKFKIWNNSKSTSLGKALLVISPLIIAFFVAASRTMDYHHHFSDIIAGALIGTGLSFFSYFLYYPSFWSENSHLPKVHHELKSTNDLQEIYVEDLSSKQETDILIESEKI